MTANPSFEANPSVGTPAGCYVKVAIGRGATCFVDSRVALHGRHALRMHVPAPDDTIAIDPFRLRLKAGKTYRFSVWGKARMAPALGPPRKRGFLRRLFSGPSPAPAPGPEPVRFAVTFPGVEAVPGEGGRAVRREFTLTDEWQQYVVSGTAKRDQKSRTKLALLTPGTAWFDLLEVVPVEE
jgi:hypothetical protein